MSDELIRTWLKLPPEPWPPDPRTLLGLEPGESDVHRIEARAQERMEQVRRYQWAHPDEVTEAMRWLAQAVVSLTNPLPHGTAEASQHLAPPPRIHVPSEPDNEDQEAIAEEVERIYTPELPPRRLAPGTWVIGFIGALALAVCLTIVGLHFHNQHLPITTEGETLAEVQGAVVLPEAATCLAFSSDSRRALSAANDVLRVWDAEKEKVAQGIRVHGGAITCAAFTPDGRRCVVGGNDKILRLWDVDSAEERAVFEGHTGPVLCLAISTDGERLLSGSEDRTIRLWRLDGSKEPVSLTGNTGAVTAIVFAAEGRQALSWSRDRSLRFWDLEKGRELRRRTAELWEGPSATLSSDGQFSLAVEGDRVRVAAVEGGRTPRSFLVQPGPITCLALSADNHRLLAGSEDGAVHLFDVDSGNEICRGLGHKRSVTCAALSPDGRRALTSSGDQTTRLWKLP
jgi:hypothetical protein